MKAIFVDDERSAHVNFTYDLKERTEIVSLTCFFKGEAALNFARENIVDCAFLDIDLGGGEDGLSLATALKEIHPDLEVVFITATTNTPETLTVWVVVPFCPSHTPRRSWTQPWHCSENSPCFTAVTRHLPTVSKKESS